MTVAVAIPRATAHATIRRIGPCRSDEDRLQRADRDDPAALAKSFAAIWTTNEASPGTGR
jgi:succinylarginine dihydrolase